MASRTQNSIRNIVTGLVGKIIVFLFAFSTKTAFARLLGTEYSGVDGLYANILSILSLADLGINNVFTFFLYKALAEMDEDKVASLVASFRKVYIGIGIAVLGIGMILIPALPVIVNSDLPQNEIILYYVLYVVNSAASYFFVYRTTVLIADQKQYISNITSVIFQIALYGAQLVYLLFTSDFVGYLVIQLICTVVQNLILSLIASKKYPYLRDKSRIRKDVLPKGTLWNNVKATFLYKICSVIINYTDNILISVLVGTAFVGRYAYYGMLLQYVSAYITLLGSGLMASVGNLNAENNREKAYSFFKTLSLTYAVITIVVVCAFSNCIQQFIPIWIGESFMLSRLSVIAMLSLMALNTIVCPISMYRETMGLFRQVQYIQIPSALINIVLSVVLGKWIGLPGILLATCIGKLATTFWYEPLVVYRNMNRSVKQYFGMILGYVGAGALCLALSGAACWFLPENLPGVVIRACFSILISGGVLWLLYHRTEAGRDLNGRILGILKRKRGK